MTKVRVTFFNFLSLPSINVEEVIDEEDLQILRRYNSKTHPDFKWQYFYHEYEEDYANYLKMKYPEIVKIHNDRR